MKKIFLILSIALICSCTTLKSSTSAQLLVEYATIKFIRNSSMPVERAKKVVRIASTAKSIFDNELKPIDEIEELIRGKIDWDDLSDSDKALANALIIRVTDEVEQATEIDDQKRVSGSKVLGWIIRGAKLAGG